MNEPKLPVNLETLMQFVRKCRSDRMSVNPGMISETTDHAEAYSTWYGRPTIQVIASNWDHIWDSPWDHTLESIREAAEVAELHGGWVLIEYPIIIADPRSAETGRVLDTGFEVQVYPKFALRTHNSFVEISTEEEGEEVPNGD
jgi:hypothetical protein